MSCSLVYANSVTIEVDPQRPVVGEEFELIFNVTTTTNTDEPYISFNAGEAEVKGRRLVGKQSNASVINGNFSTSSKYKYAYTLVSPKAGGLTIYDIKVDIDGKTITVPNRTILVASENVAPKDFFLVAEVSKTEAYLGEGLNVNYYLYSRSQNLGRTEIEIFPKLNNFIKRFYMPQNERETVEYRGAVYRRSLEYSARVYAEKVGKLKIDPLRLKFQYTEYRDNRNLGNFGFSFGRPKIKSLSSEPVTINVLPLPEGQPQGFTGLIGQHDFKIKVNKNRFLVNEAIEVKLEITGPGALENYPAPTLYQDPSLEMFDTKSELSEIDKSNGKKVFEYTYLARSPLTFKEKTIPFTFFDPQTKNYMTQEVVLPPLLIGGGEVKAQTSGNESQTENKNTTEEPPKTIATEGSIIAPDFENIKGSFGNNWIKLLNYLLILLIVFVFIEKLASGIMNKGVPQEALSLTHEIKTKGINYSLLNKYLRLTHRYRRDIDNKLTLEEIVEKLPVSIGCKKYFIENVQITENMEYKDSGKDYKTKFIKKHFDELNSNMMQK